MIFINQNFTQWLSLSLTGSLYTEFRVGTSSSTSIVVDWGDGSLVSYSGNLMTISHTYSSAFTGNIKITCSSGNDLINRIDNFSESNTANSITFTTAQIGAFTNLQYFICLTSNLISGNLSSLSSTLIEIQFYGSNTVTGDIGLLPSNLLKIHLSGYNTTYGNIANLPTTLLQYNNLGVNTTTGNIGLLPSSLTLYSNDGYNTTSGSIGSLPSGLTYYYNHGNNTTSGSIASLPSGLTIYSNNGYNTTSGNISGLPSGLTYYRNIGNNTATGNIANIPSNIEYFHNQGLNTVVDYTSGRTWKDPMRTFISLPTSASGGLSSTEVDNLLINLSVPNWVITNVLDTKIVNIGGYNAARTSASNSAVSTLISKGVTVITN